MKKIVVGILAHVDAGKTTCIESMLYNSGKIRKIGRVDHQDAFLDYDSQERDRGITIYSKEANMSWKNAEIYLIDTPGHVDFSSEMERSLQVLDLAILLISGQDGVQNHTETIWECLKHYHVPTLIFVNKMDISYKSVEELMEDIHAKCSPNCIDFTSEERYENLGTINEDMLNEYLENETISNALIQQAVFKRECFPVFFGSALKNDGIEELMDAMDLYSLDKEYGEEFGAKVYKITTDEQGNRLAHIKVTSGVLYPKQKLDEENKVDQIRLYSGQKFTMLDKCEAGMVCAIKGLTNFEVGQGLGIEKNSEQPLLNAYMNYQLLLPRGVDAIKMMETLSQLAAEDPQLQIQFDEESKRIHIRIMGAIQIEVLQKRIEERSGVKVGFGTGRVVFKETITEPVLGVGHFEPLRHYAEVVLKLEPLPHGRGMVYECDIPMEELAFNWQRLILTHLQERDHRGVLTGSAITDMKISLLAGKAHLKHTEGGDFRQATYRAIRMGLKMSESQLLEPYYNFVMELESDNLGKALFDLESKHCEVQIEDLMNGWMRIKGIGPVRLLQNYQNEVIALTKGKGKYTCSLDGYYPCKDAEQIIEEIGYDSEHDFRNPTGSVFCEHGSGFYVPYDEVMEHMHIQLKNEASTSTLQARKYTINEDELKRVFNMAGGQNKSSEKEKQKKFKAKKKIEMKTDDKVSIVPKLPTMLVVDGYNMIFAWSEFASLRNDISSARDRLIDILTNYVGYKNYQLLLVFDGYRVKDNIGEEHKKGSVKIVYTKHNQTADSYIEKAVHDLKKEYNLLVATSDGLIQNAILAQGARRMSARELEGSVKNANMLIHKKMTF